MSHLISDGSLVCFFPLNEPSGAPLWKNHSPAFAKAPSGISFDLSVAVADTANLEEFMSVWPGLGSHLNPESGTIYTGYQVQGSWKFNTDSSPLSNYLLLGGGCSRATQQLWQPNVANSGFTAGLWIYPNSDGYENFQDDATLAAYSWETEAAHSHSLMGAFNTAINDAGWHIGISGIRSRGAQFNFDLLASKQLRAFAFIEQLGGAPTDSLNVPIESGRYTHITYTYRFVNGTINEVVLYKDGHVAASGTTTANLTASNTNLITTSLARTLGIGNSDDGTAVTDEYERTSGWNHLVSGAYFFKRVLHEGEVLEMHLQGGLQPQPTNLILASETSITSDYLIGYYPFMEPGYGDISRNQRPCISNFDLGNSTERVLAPGPYGFGASFHNGVAPSDYHAMTSGTCFDLLAQRSWTIGTWFSVQNANNRDDNMWMSWGSVTASTAATDEPAATALTVHTAGLCGTVSGIANQQRVVLEIYPLGNTQDVANNMVFNLFGTWEYYNQSRFHIAVAYDDSTRGIAVYLNGAFAESGTLNHSLTEHLLHVAGSGFPLMFGNGITDQIVDATTKGLHAAGGVDCWLGPVFLANKALVEPEIRGIVLSGIPDLPRLFKTRHDPRLVGYWSCSTFQLSDTMVLDEARVWNQVPGHLLRGDTFASDERWYDRDGNEGAGVFREDSTARIDQFGLRTLPPELASYGNLGITSGIFVSNGGSLGTAVVADAADARSALNNFASRYKPVIEIRSGKAQNIAGQHIICFEVTPSGRIPAVDIMRTSATNEVNTNCLLFALGNQAITPATGDAEYHIFLTSINSINPDPLGADAGLSGSGITIRVDASEDAFAAATHMPLVSGRVPFGIPSRILVHTKFDDPYEFNALAAGASNFTISLWINGTLIQRRTITQNQSRIWSDGTVDSASDTTLLQLGGVLGNDVLNIQPTWQGGLGDIYMREVFVMRGVFDKGEVEALAASGIQTPTIPGYTDQKSTTQVTLADSSLKGYWRFNGFEGGGSGTTDLSFNNNHLFPAAQRYIETVGTSQAAVLMRMSPAMFSQNDIDVRCSGVTYASRAFTDTAPNRIPLFMVSGVAFNDPNAGFSVGFYLKKKAIVATNRFDSIITYGLLGTASASDAGTDEDRGWTIGTDDADNIKMVLSTAGNMFLSSAANSALGGQVVCGVFGDGGKNTDLDDLKSFEREHMGDVQPPRLDSWAHYCWTFNDDDQLVRCYLNGELVDQVPMKSPGIQVPTALEARYITFFQHSLAPWDFNALNLADLESVLTEAFYFARPLTDGEVLYIALNGIDNAVGTPVSGFIGGYIHGQDTASGIIGGYTKGQDFASGIFGGYMPGGTLASGVIGGYISGTIFADGTIGGWVRGMDFVSGILGGYVKGLDVGSGFIAGYIKGQEVGSGFLGGLIYAALAGTGIIGGFTLGSDEAQNHIGGFILGGLQSHFQFDGGFTLSVLAAEDFDAQIEIAKTAASDFDAKIVIFQNELPPLVGIIIPGSTVTGLVPPFNQYFIGAASGLQGKTIANTKWNFGDFTPTISVSQSGEGFYPTSHRFTTSGVFMVRFSAIDSDGLHNSAIRIINIASGIDPVRISLSGVPRSGNTGIIVDFDTNIDTLPPNVSVITQLLDFDDGQTTIAFDPVHVYNSPGVMKPIWIVRDSRGFIFSDSLESGANN